MNARPPPFRFLFPIVLILALLAVRLPVADSAATSGRPGYLTVPQLRNRLLQNSPTAARLSQQPQQRNTPPSTSLTSTSISTVAARMFKPTARGLTFDPCKFHSDCIDKRLCVLGDFTKACAGSAGCLCIGQYTQLCKSCTECDLYPEESCLYNIGDGRNTAADGVCGSSFTLTEGITREADCDSVPKRTSKYSCVYDTARTAAGVRVRCACRPNGESNGKTESAEVWSVVAGGATVDRVKRCLHSSIALRATCAAHRLPAFSSMARRARRVCCALYGGRFLAGGGGVCALKQDNVSVGQIRPKPLTPPKSGCRDAVRRVARGVEARCACAAGAGASRKGKSATSIGKTVTVASGVSASCVRNCVARAMGKSVCVAANSKAEQESELKARAKFCCGGCGGNWEASQKMCQYRVQNDRAIESEF